jgi:cellulose synthase/poly-beta-1,6-N-acetylglucosamine synthase-like glycosyltransferase
VSLSEWIVISCLVLTFHAYLGYPIVLWLLTAWRKAPPDIAKDLDTLPCVTMIIPAFNEAPVIRQKLENCAGLNYPADRLDVIVGSDGSTDGTNDLVSSFAGARVRLSALPDHQGKAAVLNRCVEQATGEILVFSDANTMYHPDAVRRLVRHFDDPAVGCVSGLLTLVNRTGDAGGHGEGAYWRFESWIKGMESRAGFLIGANGAIYAIRRRLFTRLPAGLINDDFFVSMKVLEQGQRVLLEPAAVGVEETAPSLEGEFARHVRDATGHFQVLPYVWRVLSPRRGLAAFGFASHRLARWAVPFVLPVCFVCSAVLIRRWPYALLLAGFGLLFGLAGIGWLARRRGARIGLLIVPLYFLTLNGAILAGFLRFLRRDLTWTKVR